MASDWEILEVVGTEEEAELIAGFLANQGFPCQVESAQSHELPVGDGNIRVEVPAGRADEARRLLAERETLGTNEQPEASDAQPSDQPSGEGVV